VNLLSLRVSGCGHLEVLQRGPNPNGGIYIYVNEAYRDCSGHSMILPETDARALRDWLNKMYPA